MALAQPNTPRALLLAVEKATNQAAREEVVASAAVAFIAAQKAAFTAEDARAAAVEAADARAVSTAAEILSEKSGAALVISEKKAAETAAAAKQAQKVAKAAADEASAARTAWNPLKRKEPLVITFSGDPDDSSSSDEAVVHVEHSDSEARDVN